MQIKIESEHLNGILVIVPEVFRDKRGFFVETYKKDQFEQLGHSIYLSSGQPFEVHYGRSSGISLPMGAANGEVDPSYYGGFAMTPLHRTGR